MKLVKLEITGKVIGGKIKIIHKDKGVKVEIDYNNMTLESSEKIKVRPGDDII